MSEKIEWFDYDSEEFTVRWSHYLPSDERFARDHPALVMFEAYEVVTTQHGKRMYQDDSVDLMKHTHDIEKSPATVSGIVKWDGCYELSIDYHGCEDDEEFLKFLAGVLAQGRDIVGYTE